MTRVTPFEERRFRTAARHYLRGRPPYAAGLIRRLVQVSGLGPGTRVMDLGCGPGQLAVALVPFVGEVVALDPEPEMLRIAAQSAAAARPSLQWRSTPRWRRCDRGADNRGRRLPRHARLAAGRLRFPHTSSSFATAFKASRRSATPKGLCRVPRISRS